ncbi:DUF4920 domain-containing protein [Algoriphagus sp. CAU 1675]|uniref:DUF4920 domain-containing protein n=1 Tax=Algoriphagus sp. CAU 1675 TaxID=3032597 RepID=UPI0023DC1822|nr:DUF4920 domain-containing protein [Algoriphagus sp. CAU 1675]MDF2158017.1 DUF4920 domain-containing protein [Algoriphagus sp. CAU 1675]
MKKTSIISFAILLGLSFSCQKSDSSHHESDSHHHETDKKSEAVIGVAEVVPGNYGAEISSNEVVTFEEMIGTVEETGTFSGKISGEIKEVCSSKGCWLTMDLPNGESMRVTFKDYGFFVPTNSQGFPIVLDGVAVLSETDVETLRHFAKDQGKSEEEIAAITEPKKEITFEAIGVVIREKA